MGYEFLCSESLYMAHKSGSMEDFAVFAPLNGHEAKKLGRKVALREDWDKIKLDVMKKVLEMKFLQNPDIKQKLIDTGDSELVEGNWWNDTFWGVCRGEGENHLGKLLMELREAYKKETESVGELK